MSENTYFIINNDLATTRTYVDTYNNVYTV